MSSHRHPQISYSDLTDIINKVGFYSINSGKPRKDLEQGINVISFILKPHSGCGK